MIQIRIINLSWSWKRKLEPTDSADLLCASNSISTAHHFRSDSAVEATSCEQLCKSLFHTVHKAKQSCESMKGLPLTTSFRALQERLPCTPSQTSSERAWRLAAFPKQSCRSKSRTSRICGQPDYDGAMQEAMKDPKVLLLPSPVTKISHDCLSLYSATVRILLRASRATGENNHVSCSNWDWQGMTCNICWVSRFSLALFQAYNRCVMTLLRMGTWVLASSFDRDLSCL